MEVGTLRRKVEKGEAASALFARANVKLGMVQDDVDFMSISKNELIAWIPDYKSDNIPANIALAVSEKDPPYVEELAAIRAYLNDESFPEPEPNVLANKILMRLSINREGEFIAQDDSATDNQCGMTGARRYRYFVTIEANNDNLTREGYVMENLWVAEYFKNRYEVEGNKCASCESMAQAAVQYFLWLFQAKDELKGVKPTRVYVRIHGSDVSFIEAEWTGKPKG